MRKSEFAALLKTPLDLIERAEAEKADHPALICYRDVRQQAPTVHSYAEFARTVRKAANGFRALGLERTQVVAYLTHNTAETHFTIWGGSAAGIVCAINPFLEPSHIALLLRQSGARILVTCGPDMDRDLWNKAVTAVESCPTVQRMIAIGAAPQPDTLTIPVTRFASLLDGADGDRLNFRDRPHPDDTAALFHTGGTTGVPKLAKHSHAGQALNGQYGAEAMDMHTDDVALVGLPLFHVNAVMVSGMGPISRGATIVIAGTSGFRDKALLDRFWALVERHRVTMFHAVPTVFASLLQSPPEGEDISSLRYGGCGGAPMPLAVFDAFEKTFNLSVVEGYGLTEGTCVVTCNPPSGNRKVGSVGMPIRDYSVRIVRWDGATATDCRAGETGALWVRGPCVFQGYLDRRQTEAVFKEADWLDTGDLARRDDDGYYWLCGRSKDIIVRGGHNIDPHLIEEALYEHPAVGSVAAVGRPDSYAGEKPVAFVSLKTGHHADPQELKAFAAGRIPERAAVPDAVYILDALEQTAVGKIVKPPLRALAARYEFENALSKYIFSGDVADVSTNIEANGLHVTLRLRSDRYRQAVKEITDAYPLQVRIDTGQ